MKRTIVMTSLLVTTVASAQLSIPWSTIDGGGQTLSAGGSFELGGTIGQPDAGPSMSGGAFQLTGGFWALTQSCFCPGDMNGDGSKDGRDIQKFVACQLAAGNCACADVDQANGISLSDVSAFVTALIAGPSCP